jgi:uncharacterized protein
MVQLRIDPWRSDFGSGAEVGFEDEAKPADLHVETADWSRPVAPAPCPPKPSVFVDGVMRNELHVMADEGDARAWGLFGSVAAGAVLCNGAAGFIAADHPVRRVLIVGSRIEVPDLTLMVGSTELTYETVSVAQDTPVGLRVKLQREMLAEEQLLAAQLTDQGLVFVDGPLRLDTTEAPMVGVVKRMVRAYLEGDEARLLGVLRPGERTPVFALGNQIVDRFAWYQRLIDQQDGWHELAGLVRCEVRVALGLGQAVAIADRVACHLPNFAGRPGVDPRAPQNLTPVGALEARLKHRLGSKLMIERALKAHLTEAVHA